MILIDTSVWVAALRQPESPIAREVGRLVVDGRVVTTGVVLAEVLQGARNVEEFKRALYDFQGFPFLEPDLAAWATTGELGFQLYRQGNAIPMVDSLIAVLAMRGGHTLLTLDEHFRRVPGLELQRS